MLLAMRLQEEEIQQQQQQQQQQQPATCFKCHSLIVKGHALRIGGQTCHYDCLKCGVCHKNFRGLSSATKIVLVQGEAYHRDCYVQNCIPDCCLCKQRVVRSYIITPFWEEILCEQHRNAKRCSMCDRVIKLGEGGQVDERRFACGECLSTAIISKEQVPDLKKDVLNMYKKLGISIKGKFPILIVSSDQINAKIRSTKGGIHAGNPKENLLGLCSGKIYVRPGLMGGVSRSGEVDMIMITSGLPYEFAGAVLAHEYMHAYFRLNKFFDIAPHIEEGMCNVCGFLWLVRNYKAATSAITHDQEVKQKPSSGFQSMRNAFRSQKKQNSMEEVKNVVGEYPKTIQFFIRRYELNPNPTYGEGFRLGVEACLKYGLDYVLTFIKKNKDFPP